MAPYEIITLFFLLPSLITSLLIVQSCRIGRLEHDVGYNIVGSIFYPVTWCIFVAILIAMLIDEFNKPVRINTYPIYEFLATDITTLWRKSK